MTKPRLSGAKLSLALVLPLLISLFLIPISPPLQRGLGGIALASDSERGIAVRARLEKASGKTVGTYRALIIGINDYKDNKIPDLKTPVNDARKLADLLKKDYGFEDIVLLLDNDANESKIIKNLRRLATKSKKDDSVLIYYAGHGDLDKITGSGWWIPYNAVASDPSTYIDNSVVQQYIKAIPARHVLLVADSCFSGTLFGESRALPPVIDDKFYATLFEEKSRWGMTSGNLTPVADSGSGGHSIFAYHFLKTLRKNQKPYFTPREIYQKIGPLIRNNSEQMPITKPIKNTGDEGGEFIFIRTAALSTSSSATDVAPELPTAPESYTPTPNTPTQGGVTQGMGDIFIESDPSEAMVYLDGERKDRTPLELNNIPAGKHRIELKKGKIYTARLEINLEPDDLIKRMVKLERAKGKVKISSDPTGARIFLDGRDTGKTTPDIIHTEAGEHELKLEKKTKKGRITHKGKIKVEPDRRVALLITDFEEMKGLEGMVYIIGNCFKMGDTFGDGDSDEKPVLEVCVDDFFIGEHEVTQGEWKEIMGNNPSSFKNCGDDCPVEEVSWNDVQDFIRKLNSKTGMNYRLPTEAEWEYAAREGGRKTRFGTGKDTIGPDEANFNARSKYKKPYSRSGIYREKTIAVKSFLPNSLGLYDMSGSVWEWVQDWFDSGYYKKSPRNNPKGPNSGKYRVLRGGSWDNIPQFVRAASRNREPTGPTEHLRRISDSPGLKLHFILLFFNPLPPEGRANFFG